MKKESDPDLGFFHRLCLYVVVKKIYKTTFLKQCNANLYAKMPLILFTESVTVNCLLFTVTAFILKRLYKALHSTSWIFGLVLCTKLAARYLVNSTDTCFRERGWVARRDLPQPQQRNPRHLIQLHLVLIRGRVSNYQRARIHSSAVVRKQFLRKSCCQERKILLRFIA